MPKYDVFVSYSSKNKKIADAAVVGLEQSGIRCWYAPRDIPPGSGYGSVIVDAIRESRIMLLIFSAAANESPHVRNEVERAVHNQLHIIPFRIESVTPTGDMEFFVSAPHWLDALPKPTKKHLEHLIATVHTVLGQEPPRKGRREWRPLLTRIFALVCCLAAIASVAAVGWYAWEDLIAENDQTAEKNGDVTKQGESESQTKASSGREGPSGETNIPSTPEGETEPEPPATPTEPGPREQPSGQSEGNAAILPPTPVSGHLGGTAGSRVDHTYHFPEHGRVRFVFRNTTPEGAANATFKTITVNDIRVGYEPGPGNLRESEYYSIKKGQSVKIRLQTHAGHRLSYEVEPEFELLSDRGLAVSDESGQFDKPTTGALGFGQSSFDNWVYRAPDNGRVRFVVLNMMPEHTNLAAIKNILIDGRRVGYEPGPGTSRESEFISVQKGQEVKIRIEAEVKNNVVYRIEPEFEDLADHGIEVSAASGRLDKTTAGALGFGQSYIDEWVYRAPGHGRFRLVIFNLMPDNTQLAAIKNVLIDERKLGYEPGPGGNRASEFFSVKSGQVVKIRVEAESGNNVVYELEPEFDAE